MMDIAFLITGFTLGLAASLHCVGMCGPLALSLPLQAKSGIGKATGILMYNSGRITSYGLLGLVTGLIGRQVSLAGYQQFFSIAIGSLLLGYFLFAGKKAAVPNRWAISGKIQSIMVKHMQDPTFKAQFITGAANGLLPCGMVYLAIASAAAVANVVDSTAFMVAFGVGTVPLMAMVSTTGLFLGPSLRKTAAKATPYITLSMGLLLILRGLNLGIPYLSPYLHIGESRTIISCH